MVLVHFPHATRLNGSTIADGERDPAERVYLRNFQDKLDKPDR